MPAITIMMITTIAANGFFDLDAVLMGTSIESFTYNTLQSDLLRASNRRAHKSLSRIVCIHRYQLSNL